MAIREKIAQPSTFVDPGKLRVFARRALLFDEVTTAHRSIVFADSPYTIDIAREADVVLFCDCTAGAITVNLPAATFVNGRHYWITKTDPSGNVVTIDPDGAELINGGASTTTDAGVIIVSNGTAWFIVADTGAAALTPPSPDIGVHNRLLATDLKLLANHYIIAPTSFEIAAGVELELDVDSELMVL